MLIEIDKYNLRLSKPFLIYNITELIYRVDRFI